MAEIVGMHLMMDRLERLEVNADEIKSFQGECSNADQYPKLNKPGFTPSEIERIPQIVHLHNSPTWTIADESAFMPPEQTRPSSQLP
jgi:hypothetical protein